MALFVCCVFVLTALRIIEASLTRSWHISQPAVLLPVLALTAFAFLQTLPLWGAGAEAVSIEGGVWRPLSVAPDETRRFMFKLLALALAGEMLVRYMSSRRRLRALIHVVIGVGLASALFGILRQTTQGDAPSFAALQLESFQGYGQFTNRNHFAFLMEMTLGLALGFAISGGVRGRRLLLYLLASSVAVWMALVLTNSRGGIFAMLGQLMFVALLFSSVRSPREHHKPRPGATNRIWRIGKTFVARATLIVSLVVVVTLCISWVGGDPLADRWGSLPKEVSSEQSYSHRNVRRIDMWRATWEFTKAHPIVGVGFGGYWVALPEYHDASGKITVAQAHNDHLELFASGGIIGVACAAWFVIVLIKRAREGLRSLSALRRGTCFGALAGLTAATIHSFVDFGLHVTLNSLIFTALIVIATVEVPNVEQVSRTGEVRDGISMSPSRFTLLATRHQSFRLAVALFAVLGCLSVVWINAREGLSRLYAEYPPAAGYAFEDRLLNSSVDAVRLNPNDPWAHYVFARMLLEKKDIHGAVMEFERAVILRPRDYFLWLQLGRARDWNGDAEGALLAFKKALRFAPYYSQPRWFLGNLLLKQGQRELAFAELSRAAASDPELLTQAADLIWKECGGDAGQVRQVIHPETISAKLALALYFDKRGVLKETLELFRQAGTAAAEERLALLTRLLTEKKFVEAYEVWLTGRGDGSAGDRGGIATITDGGFEGDIDLSEPGFGWRQVAYNMNAMGVSLDASEPGAGSRSLHIDFHGSPSPENTISQLVLVEAGTNYRLSFAARARSLVTGGLPVITVTDMSNAGKLFGQSAPLTSDRNGWQEYSVEFATTTTTGAVMIEIRRQQCATKLCPIFGFVWLDNFSLQKV